MTQGANLNSGALLQESFAIFRRNWPLLLIAGAFEGLIEFGQRVENRERLVGLTGVILIGVLVTVMGMAVQGVAARSVFVREGIVDAVVPPRMGAYIGVSILVLLGMVFGMMLLIVPGILLALRWSLAANFTLTREMGVLEALQGSRDATAGHRGEIFGVYVVFGLGTYVPMFALLPLAGGVGALQSVDPWSLMGAIRVVWGVFTGMAGLALSIGIFSTFVGRHGGLQEVFA